MLKLILQSEPFVQRVRNIIVVVRVLHVVCETFTIVCEYFQ